MYHFLFAMIVKDGLWRLFLSGGKEGELNHLYAGRTNACGRVVPNSRCSNLNPAFLAASFSLISPPLTSEYTKTTSASTRLCFHISPLRFPISRNILGKLFGVMSSGNLRLGMINDSATSSSSGDSGLGTV